MLYFSSEVKLEVQKVAGSKETWITKISGNYGPSLSISFLRHRLCILHLQAGTHCITTVSSKPAPDCHTSARRV